MLATLVQKNNPAYIRRRIMWKAVNRVRNKFSKRLVNMWVRQMHKALDGDVLAISEAMRITFVEVGGSFARSQFNRIRRQKALGDVEDQFDEILARYSRDEMGNITQSISNTNSALKAKILADDLILDKIAEIDRMILARASLVTQNEIVRASNVGQDMGADAAVRVEASTYVKTWIATIDNRVRDGHADADGQTVRGQNNFIATGEALKFPKDPAGTVANTINCRCVVDYHKLKS